MGINSGRSNIRPTLADHRWMILSSTSYLFAGMYDDTRIFANGSLIDTLNKQEIKSISLSANDIISSNRPISFSRSGSGQTGIAYAWEGVLFAHRCDRVNPSFFIVATREDASVEIEDSRNLGSNYFSGTISTTSFTEVNTGDTNSQFIIRSLDNPIAVYVGDLPTDDCMPLYPCTTEIFGTASRSESDMIATEDNTTITELATDGSTTTRTLNKGDSSGFSFTSGSQFSSRSVKLVADKPISAFQQADSDGLEVTPFVGKESFGKKFVIPENEREFVKLVSDVPAVATAYDTSGNVLSTTTLAGSEANGVYNARLTGTSAYEGVLIETDQPVYAVYEGEADDETVLPAHYPSEFEVAYSPKISTDSLVLSLDAANPKSYPGSGSTVTDVSNNGGVGEIVGTSFDSTNQSFYFNNGDRIGFGRDGGTLSVKPGDTNELSVCAWIKPDNPADSRAPITRIDRWYFQVYSQDRLATYWYGRSPSGYHYSTTNSIPMNQWSFASVVWSTSDIKFYINGELDRTISGVGGTGDQNDYVRVGYESSSREYEGNISQVSVYNRELSESEIKQNFNALRGRYGI